MNPRPTEPPATVFETAENTLICRAFDPCSPVCSPVTNRQNGLGCRLVIVVVCRSGVRDLAALVEAALNRRELLRALAAERQAIGLTQTEVAAALGTSQAQVARLESGNADAKLSTISRLAAVLGKTIECTVTDAKPVPKSGKRPTATGRGRSAKSAARS